MKNKDESWKLIGERIRDLRLEKSITQKSLAELAKIDRTGLNLVESGTHPVSIKSLYAISAALGVSPCDLI